jgi:hypothetical protein
VLLVPAGCWTHPLEPTDRRPGRNGSTAVVEKFLGSH